MDPSAQSSGRKKSNDYVDWQGFSCESEYGIPRLCPCGGEIFEEVLEEEEHDTCPGKRYFVCKKYKKPDGTHIRTPWVYGVSEEIERLIRRVEEAERVVSGVDDMLEKIKALEDEVKKLKSEVNYLDVQVDLLENIDFSVVKKKKGEHKLLLINKGLKTLL